MTKNDESLEEKIRKLAKKRWGWYRDDMYKEDYKTLAQIAKEHYASLIHRRENKSRNLGYIDGWMACADGKPLTLKNKSQLTENGGE